jgi:type III secretion system HrpB2-like protein
MTPLPPALPADAACISAELLTKDIAKPVGDPAAAERFAALMNGGPAAAPSHTEVHDAARLVQGEQDRIHSMEQRMQSFSDAAPHMSVAEVTAANIQLTHEMAMTTTRLSLATTVTKKSSDSFNSLLKNQ